MEYRGQKETSKEENNWSRLSGRHLHKEATFSLALLTLTNILICHLIEATIALLTSTNILICHLIEATIYSLEKYLFICSSPIYSFQIL